MGKKRVIGNSFIYIFCSLLLKACSFFLLPLYTAYLTTAEYGTVNLLSSFTGVASMIIACALYYSIVRFYVELKEDREKVKRFFGTLVVFVFVSGIVFSLTITLFNNFFTHLLFKNIYFYPTVMISLISLVFYSVYFIYEYILKGMENAKKYAAITSFYFFLQLGLSIYFLVFLHWGVNGVLLSTLITNFVCTIYMIIDLKKNDLIILCLDWPLLKEALKYSVPLLPHNLSTNITSLVSSIFINNSFTLRSVGIFSLATQFGTIADVIQVYANNAFQPWFYNQMNKQEKDFKKGIRELSQILIKIYGLLFLMLALFSQEAILLLADPSYYKAWTVVPLIVITYSIKTMYYFYSNVLFYYKRAARFIFIATLSSSLLNILLSAIFIPYWDMYGSVLADAITMVIRVGIIVAMSNHFDDLGYRVVDFVKAAALDILFIGAGLVFSYTVFMYEFNWLNILYKCMIIVLYAFIAFKAYTGKIKELWGNAKHELKRSN